MFHCGCLDALIALISTFLLTYFCLLGSDPSYAAFHDEEWGVPVHDDK